MNDASDLMSLCKLKNKEAEEETVQKAMDTLGDFLMDLRDTIAKTSLMKPEDASDEVVESLDDKIQAGVAHKTGMSEKLRKIKVDIK